MIGKSVKLTVMLIASGCAFQTYSPKPIDPEVSASQFDARAIDTPPLREYLESKGVSEWPVRNWGLHELTLLAFYHHPEIEAARARAAVARAQEFSARQPLNPRLDIGSEHHSVTDGKSPWTLKFYLDIPIITSGKREIQLEQAGYAAKTAELNAGSVAWKVRSNLRSRLLDYFAAHEESQLLNRESAGRNEVLQLLEKRVQFGMIAQHESAVARERLLDSTLRATRKEAEAEEARTALADAVGMPAQAVRGLALALDNFREAIAVDDLAAARREALINRLDVRRSLLEYAVAEAALELEIARQYPDFNLKPGYEWDQEDNVWALAVSLILPLLHKNEGPILEAREKRELKAREFTALQAQIIAQTEAAALRYENARAEFVKAEELTRSAQEQGARVKRRFDAGDADRLDWVNARLQTTFAEQAKLAAAIRLQRARSALEDTLQRPLDAGFELPSARN
jgi:outer membrane protein, heavy metal efflux system